MRDRQRIARPHTTSVRLSLCLAVILMSATPPIVMGQPVPSPPKTLVEEVVDTLHGIKVPDPYRWLEDQNSPATRKWLDSQIDYTHSLLASYPRRAPIEKRLTELLKIATISTPTYRKGYYYYYRRDVEQAQPVYYRRKGENGEETALIDPNVMSEDKSLTVRIFDISEDGSLLAYGIQRGGEDEVEVRFMETSTQKPLPDVLSRQRYFGGVNLLANKKGVYYGVNETAGPRVRYHAFGSDVKSDPLVFGQDYKPGQLIGVSLSEKSEILLIQVFYGSASTKSDIYIKNLVENGPIIPIVNDIEARFEGTVIGDSLYMETNWNAPNGRLLKVNLKQPGRDHWREVIPTSETSVLQSVSFVGGRLFANYLENVSSRIRIFTPDGKPDGEIGFPTLGTASGVSGEWKRKEAFYSFSSFTTPTTIYRFDVATKSEREWARLKVPIDPNRFEVKQVFYPSKDGTKIPMFLIHAKGLVLDGSRPTLLYGYGGFNISLTPSFSSMAALWAESGGVYAIANLRGGGEFGEAWHKAGMLEKKQNVFDDFIGAAEWLIKNGITQPSKLAISGGSNGGLLVGAALTQRPELFQAVVCGVPLLDMVRYHQFLVARFWIPEYGSSEDAAQFKTLLAYSPYHNVKKGVKYPATLFVTGDADTRVAPLHARKMAALLQSATASDRPILLHYDLKSGHSGGKPVNKQIVDVADELSFLFWQLGIEPKP